MFDDFLDFLRKLWVWSYIALVIGFIALPACTNHNMDVNKVPQVATVVTNTRFSYKRDFFEPIGICMAITALAPITAPIVLYGDYRVYTNKVQVGANGMIK